MGMANGIIKIMCAKPTSLLSFGRNEINWSIAWRIAFGRDGMPVTTSVCLLNSFDCNTRMAWVKIDKLVQVAV